MEGSAITSWEPFHPLEGSLGPGAEPEMPTKPRKYLRGAPAPGPEKTPKSPGNSPGKDLPDSSRLPGDRPRDFWQVPGLSDQARKRYININFFVRLVLGFTGFVPGTNPVCPWDKPGENLGQTQVFSLFYTVEARFHRVCPWDKPSSSLGQSRGRREAQRVYVKKVYVPFSLAIGGKTLSRTLSRHFGPLRAQDPARGRLVSQALHLKHHCGILIEASLLRAV